MVTIKVGDKQPLPCDSCNDFFGYQYSDYMSLHYTSYHSPDGDYEGGQYSDSSKYLNYGRTASCCNCGRKLPFKLQRDLREELSGQASF